MNNKEYKFVETDVNTIKREMISDYEAETKLTLRPASPEAVFINWLANIIVHERSLINRAGNRNIPSRSDGEDLEALGELYFETKRPKAKAAVCTERFYITEICNKTIVVPRGTRVTDSSGNMHWQTTADGFIEAGELFVDVPIICQVAGIDGNGFEPGQLSVIVDVFEYFDKCENVIVSNGGADEATDEEYYALMVASEDGYSCAGPSGGYEYLAKQVSTEIADVVAVSSSDSKVLIYTLMKDGSFADETTKRLILDACTPKNNRPLTDHVSVADANEIKFNIELTYFIPETSELSASQIETNVKEAVNKYIEWQRGKFGRDILPSKLQEFLIGTGIKRPVITQPIYQEIKDGRDNDGTVPEVANVSDTIEIVFGGIEDE